MERGDDIEDRHVLVLDDEADLQRLLSPTNLELLRAIREHEPESMRAAADLVERDFKDVHRNLTEIETLNVIEFEQSGRSKRPIVRFDEIDVEITLDSGDTDVAAA
jgi:predicted transcriptional regulator